MSIRQIFIAGIFSLVVCIGNAQTGTIKGRVSTSDGKPAELVNILLEKSGRNTIVNPTDVEYWDPTGFPLLTRNYVANFSFKF